MKSLNEIKTEITKCKAEQRELQDNEDKIDPNNYIARNQNHCQRIQLASRIDTLFWVWENY